MAVSSGTYTVGTAGNYATWAAAQADIAATLTGNLTFNQISDTVEPGTPSGGLIDLAGKTITFKSLSPHDGDPTAGYKAICTSSPSNRWVINMSIGTFAGGTGLLRIYDLNIQKDGTGGGGLYVDALGPDVEVHDIIGDGTGSTGTGFSLDTEPFGRSTIEVWNCESEGFGSGFGIVLVNGLMTIENCTASNASTYGFNCGGAFAATFRNCVAFGAGNSDFAFNLNATGRNNASEDTSAQDGNWSTGTGNVTSITPASEFLSLSISDPDFVRVKEGGSCEASGTNPTLSSTGIRGNARPGPDALYSIGADEFVPPPPTTRAGIQAKQVQLDVANFDGVLSANEKTVQQAIDVLDDKAAVASRDNQNMAASATSSDEDVACATAIVSTPIGNGLVEVRVNGHTIHVGDGSKVADCYFSADGGTNVRNMASIEAGDKLYWIGSIAGYQLTAVDRVSFVYEA